MSFTKDHHVLIVGAGVFGLSIALHLACDDSGLSNVTVFDTKPYGQNFYDQDRECDAASADINKIFRASYGHKTAYQRLAYSARDVWKRWNADLAATPLELRPTGLKFTHELYTECGYLRLPGSPNDPLSEDELAGLASLEKHFPEYRLKNYIIDDPAERRRAVADGWQDTLESVKWSGTGVLDATAGSIRADKACIWLAYLARKAGVHFVQGEACGKVVEFVEETESTGERRVRGVRTADGKTHAGTLVIVAGGGWTPMLVPETRQLLETTAGSITTLMLPPLGKWVELWERFSEKRWPVLTKGIDDPETGFKGVYSFPHVDGFIKIGYRSTKYTNYRDLPDGSRISVPVTAYTTPSQTNVPLEAIHAVKDYVQCHFPELIPLGISHTRLCWYTDSIDNHFLIDYVPGYGKSLFVASGGSGHGFKFAPVLGAHVLDALKGHETELTSLWKWRPVPEGKRNGLEEGENGPRVLSKQIMATEQDWKFDP